MTLTLEQVRQTRFHLARRNGYEPVDVDNFVDKVEVTLAQLSAEFHERMVAGCHGHKEIEHGDSGNDYIYAGLGTLETLGRIERG